jgi:hypothetical protein
MSKARRLFHFNLGLAAFGALVATASLVVGVRSLELGRPPLSQLEAACHRLVPQVTLGHGLLLVLIAVGSLVLWRALSSGFRQLLAQRRFLRSLPGSAATVLLGQRVRVVDERRPRAFCAGYLRPNIYLSRGALEELSEPQLRAVLAHERHHQLRHDPLRIAAGRVLAEAFFFIPSLRASTQRYTALAELAADEAAVGRVGSRPLAAAMLRMARADTAMQSVVGIAPERIDHLAGAPPRWRLSPLSFLTSLLLAALLLVVTLTAAALLGGARLNLVLLAAQSCMPLMTLATLAGLAFGLQLLRPSLVRRR